MPEPPTLREVVELVEGWYPPATAEAWDAVGLVWGDPEATVRRILLAVDPAPAVAAEAAEWGADLLLVHHPLFLRPVHGFAPLTPKGKTLSTLVGAGCALLTAHTNADHAAGGVSDALALAVGLRDREPIVPGEAEARDKIVVFAPVEAADAVRAALAAAGAGRIGDYDHASFTGLGEGRFRPRPGASPAIGSVGRHETVPEVRIEALLPRSRRRAVVGSVVAAHPYEEPAYDVYELADPGHLRAGTGRVGSVPPTTLRDFARTVATALPETAPGIRVAGDPGRVVRRVAVLGGAGDFLLDRVAALDVDAYLTSDLRHHPAAEFSERGGPALVDVPHWAAEWTWLPALRDRLDAALAAQGPGDTVVTRVSEVRTDPWSFRV